MASHPATPYQTTLSAALTASAGTVYTAASTGFVIGGYLVIGKEVLLLTKCDTTNHVHEVKRGMKGTAAVKHASSAIVSFGAASVFGPNTTDGVEVAGYVGEFASPVLPIGSRYVDPDTGYEYILCDSGNSYIKGEWVIISAAGAATQLATTSQGRVGLVTEAVGASDKLFWVMVVGASDYALLASQVTTAMPLSAEAGFLESTTSGTNVPVVRGVTCTSIPVTTTSPFTNAHYGSVYLCNPWITAGDILVS
jgi:hypothetical protein